MIPIPEEPTMRDASDLGRGLKNNLVERDWANHENHEQCSGKAKGEGLSYSSRS
jgi:hypothetical protein